MPLYKYSKQARLPCELQHNEHDVDLWNKTGDCIVYLDDSSAVSTAYRLSTDVLHQHNATFLLKRIQSLPRAQSPRSFDGSDSGYESSHGGIQEVHIDVPVGLSADDVVDYHITTRNYFACLLQKPVIGASLGAAIRDVWQRIQRWHEGGEVHYEMLQQYCQQEGYMDFLGKPANALAMLAFAEGARLRALWINAFAHCVAMQDRITAVPEYSALGNTTKALITKAALDMEMQISKVLKTLSNFLEAELSAEHLGLPKLARDHLDQFKEFLYDFFVEKHGSYPPQDNEPFDKALWADMHDDFQGLYDYLVDLEASSDTLGDRGVSGGVCVWQNVDAFNQKHCFRPLPHALPLMPSLRSQKRSPEAQSSGMMGFKLMRAESDFRPSFRQALADATNSDDAALLEKSIVQEYIHFEGQRSEDKLSILEARKVRWLLIYCTLQMLKSIVMAPAEVADAEQADYPLCIDASICPIQAASVLHSRTHSVTSVQNGIGLTPPAAETVSNWNSIRPDCEADNARDFFAGRRSSVVMDKSEDEEVQSVTRETTPTLSRSLSIRTSVSSSMSALQKSVIGSLSRKNSSRRSTLLIPKKMPSLQDISAEDEAEDDGDDVNLDESLAFCESPVAIERAVAIGIPTLEDYQLDMLTSAEHAPLVDEQMSPISDSSRRGSTYSECDTPPTEPSSRSNSYRESKIMGLLAPLEEDSVLITRSQGNRPAHHSGSSTASLNSGCYMPSGANRTRDAAPTSKFATPQRRHVYERRQDRIEGSGSTPGSPLREQSRPLHNRYTGDSRRYTWGDLP